MHRAPDSRSPSIVFAAGDLAAFTLAVMWLGACAPTSRRAVCEPLEGKGCGARERCIVDATGEPACVRGAGKVKLDETCATPADCPAGAACLAIDGLAQCRLLCNPQQPVGAATCRGEEARCVASVDGHPEFGLCVRPCQTPGDTAAACPAGDPPSACWVPTGLDFAVCSGTPGEARVGAPCGTDTRCSPDLLCVPLGASAACRTLAPCEVGQFELPFPGAARYRICAPCRPVAGPLIGDGDAVRHLVCAADEGQPAASARCRSEGGRLVSVAVGLEAGLGEAAANLVDGAVLFAGGCWVDGVAAPCATGHAVCRIETAR